jgi:hypothetical protein
VRYSLGPRSQRNLFGIGLSLPTGSITELATGQNLEKQSAQVR